MRFTMLETIRESALEQLAASDEAGAARQRYADHYRQLSEAASVQLVGKQQRSWLARLERDHDNLRAALATLLAGPKVEAALGMTTNLMTFWDLDGYFSEGRRWMVQALDRYPAADALRATAFERMGTLAFRQGDYEAARTCYDQALAIGRQTASWHVIVATLSSYAQMMIQGLSDHPQAKGLLDEALAVAEAHDDRLGLARVRGLLGTLAFYQSDIAIAEQEFEQAAVIYRELDDALSVARINNNLAVIAAERGDLEPAVAHWQESLTLYREVNNRPDAAFILGNIADIRRRQGHYEEAKAMLRESLAIREELGAKLDIIRTSTTLAQVYLNEGNFTTAQSLYLDALAALYKLNSRRDMLNSLMRLGWALAGRHQATAATRLLAASRHQRDLLAIPLTSSQLAEHEHVLSLLHQQLDADNFAALWAEGEAMSLDQVVAYALEQQP